MRPAAAASLALALATLVTLVPAAASADGWLSMRGGYYKERSTRVVQPMIDGQVETSEQGTFQFHGLVDSITSASAAAGNPTGQEFTELRYEGGVGYLHAFGALKLGGSFRTSTESDYDSNFVAVRGELELFDKNTLLGLSLGRSFDEITNGVAVMGPGALQQESLHTGITSLSVSQVLSPQLVGNLVFDFIDAHGYQANLYRRVTGGVAPVAERVPDLRLRGALFAGLRGFLCRSVTTGVLGYRLYTDDWGVLAHTAEARVIQQVIPGLELRLRYRFHTQTAAEFYQDIYSAQEIQTAAYVTEDAKLSALQTHTFGSQVVVALSLFGVEGSWSEVRLDAILERVLQDAYFGDAWSAQLGLVVPFAY